MIKPMYTKNFRSNDKTHFVATLPSIRYDKDNHTMQSSSGRFTVDLNAGTAHSYGWWAIMRMNKARTILVRNTCGYSMQTGMHQDMLDRILELEGLKESGIKVINVYCKWGVNNIEKQIHDELYRSIYFKTNNTKSIKDLQYAQKVLGDRVTKINRTMVAEITEKAVSTKQSKNKWNRLHRAQKKHHDLNTLGLYTLDQWTAIKSGESSYHIANIDRPEFGTFESITKRFNDELKTIVNG